MTTRGIMKQIGNYFENFRCGCCPDMSREKSQVTDSTGRKIIIESVPRADMNSHELLEAYHRTVVSYAARNQAILHEAYEGKMIALLLHPMSDECIIVDNDSNPTALTSRAREKYLAGNCVHFVSIGEGVCQG